MVKPGELSDMPECMSDAEDEIRSLRAQLTTKDQEIERLKAELEKFQELKDYTHYLVDFVLNCQNPYYADVARKAKKIAAPGVKLSELKGILRPVEEDPPCPS